VLLFALILTLRHLFYDKGWLKSSQTEIPSICVGNLSVGGTGKTPFTELIIRTLKEDRIEAADSELYGFTGSLFDVVPKSVAVVSRGYKRKTKGFLQVTADGSAEQFGDEPLQIKRKFPDVTVVVDENRTEACAKLAHPDTPGYGRPDLIILDDAYQHRKVVPTRSILLTTYSRPFFHDVLLPIGRLRDLRSRATKADMIVVTKCPSFIDNAGRQKWAKKIGLNDFNLETCEGVNREGKVQKLLFATINYEKLKSVFPEGDPRYTHSKSMLLYSGIADDGPLTSTLCETYKMMEHISYPDHHFFSKADIRSMEDAAKRYPTALLVTTEKDAQRLLAANVNDELRKRLFYAPISTRMLTNEEQTILKDFINN